MTPERLTEIRKHCEYAETVGVSFSISNVHAAYVDRADLLVEVDRLRKRQEDHDPANEAIRWKREALRLRSGVEAIHRPEPFHDDPNSTFCANCQRTAGSWPCETAALLNPTGKEGLS